MSTATTIYSELQTSKKQRQGRVIPQSLLSVATNPPILDIPCLVTPYVAAEILGRSPATLKRWRYEGIGPNYVDFEGRIRYDLHVLRDYIEKHTRVPSVRAALEEIS